MSIKYDMIKVKKRTQNLQKFAQKLHKESLTMVKKNFLKLKHRIQKLEKSQQVE